MCVAVWRWQNQIRKSGGGPLEDTCWSCGILGLIKIPPEKKDKKRDNRPKKEMTDEQTDMQSWERKR
jgi:hypothetical protein